MNGGSTAWGCPVLHAGNGARLRFSAGSGTGRAARAAAPRLRGQLPAWTERVLSNKLRSPPGDSCGWWLESGRGGL